MVSHGKVLNLFDKSYFDLQDVRGHVEPLPQVTPYSGGWDESIIVYQTEADHHVFLGQMQDFTDRLARRTETELWTWIVQWDVADREALQQFEAPRKRMKLWTDSLVPPVQPQGPIPRALPPKDKDHTTMQRRHMDRELLQQRAVQRALLAVVQTEHSVVPNVLELFYQVIDYLEGDGQALKYAAHEEIPSLWDFEEHPVLLRKLRGEELRKARKTAMEASARMRYQEKQHGMRPPKLEDMIKDKTNIPDDGFKRCRYMAACLKSRKRALDLLLEAGMTIKQVRNFHPRQKEYPLDTPEEGQGKGLWMFDDNKRYWNSMHITKQTRERRTMEMLMNEDLEDEAQNAARHAAFASIGLNLHDVHNGQEGNRPSTTLPAPLIPSTPLTAFRTSAPLRARNLQFPCQIGPIICYNLGPFFASIPSYPVSLFGQLKSQLFKSATATIATPLADRIHAAPITPTIPAAATVQPGLFAGSQQTGFDDDDDSDDEDDDDIDPDDIDPDERSDGDSTDIVMDDLPEGEEDVVDDGPRPALLPPTFALPANWQQMGIDPIATYLSQLNGQQMGQLMANVLPALQQPLGTYQPPQQPIAAQPVDLATLMQDATRAPDLAIQGLIAPQSAASQSAAPHSPHALGPVMNSAPTQVPHLGHGMLTQSGQVPPNITVTGPLNPDHGHPSPPPGQAPGNDLAVPSTLQHSALSPGLQNLNMDTPLPTDVHLPAYVEPRESILPNPSSFLTVPRITSFSARRALNRTNIPPSLTMPASTDAEAALARLKAAGSIMPRTPRGIPILIHYPHILTERKVLGEREKTDAVMLGYIQPGESNISLTHAIFIPAAISEMLRRRIREKTYLVLETYMRPPHLRTPHPLQPTSQNRRRDSPAPLTPTAHEHAYTKLLSAYSFMSGARQRERDLTKRWRATPGPMTSRERGSVCEGWAVTVDRTLGMSAQERRGAVVALDLGPGKTGREKSDEEWRREALRIMDEEDDQNGEMDVDMGNV